MKQGMMNKIFLITLCFLFIFNFVAVSAATSDDIQSATTEVSKGIKGAITGVIEGLFGEQNETAIIKTLFFILVFLIIITVLGVVPLFHEKNTTKFLVALVVTILSVMFIPADFIKPMLDPYSALGITLISVIPFILLWVFTSSMLQNSFLRKLTWMFYAIMLLGLTVYTSINVVGESWFAAITVWIYGLASVLALLMVFFHDFIERNIWKGKMQGKMTAAQRRMQKRLALDTLKEQEAEAQGLGE